MSDEELSSKIVFWGNSPFIDLYDGREAYLNQDILVLHIFNKYHINTIQIYVI